MQADLGGAGDPREGAARAGIGLRSREPVAPRRPCKEECEMILVLLWLALQDGLDVGTMRPEVAG
jgi:hypothetical protein